MPGSESDGSDVQRDRGDVDLFDVVPVLAGEVVHAVDDPAVVFRAGDGSVLGLREELEEFGVIVMDGQVVFLVRLHGAREPSAGGEQDEAGVVQQGLFQDVVSGVAVRLQVADDDVQAQVESGDAEEIADGVQHWDVAGE